MRNLIIISEACQYLYKKCGNCCILTLAILGMQDSKNFGWEINGDINFNWKTLLENKVGATKTKKTQSFILMHAIHKHRQSSTATIL
jgi:hypothetical protein